MKKLIVAIFGIMAMFSANLKPAMAAEYAANAVTIVNVYSVIASRPGVNTSPFARVTFNPPASLGSCNATAADIVQTPANNHMVALLLSALAQKKTVTIVVDSAMTQLTNEGICIATVIKVPL